MDWQSPADSGVFLECSRAPLLQIFEPSLLNILCRSVQVFRPQPSFDTQPPSPGIDRFSAGV